MTALLIERTTRLREREWDLVMADWGDSVVADWEAPAGGLLARARIDDTPYTCIGVEDPHLQGQACTVLEAVASDTDECLVVFCCGCRAYVSQSKLIR